MIRTILLLMLTFFGSQLIFSCGNPGEFASFQQELKEVIPGPTPGPGVELKDHTDTFIQEFNRPKVDILWVVDNSGSMKDEQQAIADNFSIFINDFLVNDIDFNMAIITTDVTENGHPVNPLNSLNRESANSNRTQFINDFKNYINVGIDGSYDERGLETVELFMAGYGSQFLRAGAYFDVIFVSDENDHSSNSLYQSFESDVESYFPGSESKIKMFSIVEIDHPDTIFRGYRYMQKSSYFGGFSADIDNSFYTTLKSVGEKIVELADSFSLTQTPYNNALVVSINGVPVTNYSYDSSTRSISFSSGTVPSGGDVITVDYSYEF